MKKFILILLVVGCMLLASFFCQNKLLAKYLVNDCMVNMEEYIEYKGYNIKINSAELWDYNTYYNSIMDKSDVIGKIAQDYVIEGHDAIVLVCYMTFEKKYDGGDADYIDTTFFRMMQNAYFKPSDFETSMAVSDTSYQIDIEVGDTIDYTMVFIAYDDMVSEELWENRGKLKYEVVLETYPDKTGFNLNNLIDKTSDVQEELKGDLNAETSLEEYVEAEIDYFEGAVGGVHDIDNMPIVYELFYSDISVEKVDNINNILESDNYSEEKWKQDLKYNSQTGDILPEVYEEGFDYIKHRYYFFEYSVENIGEDIIVFDPDCVYIGVECDVHKSISRSEHMYMDYSGTIDEFGDCIINPGEKHTIFLLTEIGFNDYCGFGEVSHVDNVYFVINPAGHEVKKTDALITFGIIEGGVDK